MGVVITARKSRHFHVLSFHGKKPGPIGCIKFCSLTFKILVDLTMPKILYTVVTWCLLLSHVPAGARTWKDTLPMHNPNVSELSGQEYLQTKEDMLLDANFNPGPEDSIVERSPSTNAPSPMPSNSPSSAPSSTPSSLPSLSPTTSPSNAPSGTPSVDDFIPISGVQNPDDPAPWFFSYDEKSQFGPKQWGSVQNPSQYYWDEFDDPGFGPWDKVLARRDVRKNLCGSGRRQSPIDLYTGGDNTCMEFHQARTNAGNFPITGKDVEKRIESNKLRLVYPRRPCSHFRHSDCHIPRPPNADFPRGWRDVMDVVHIDFKTPSEHKIMGERFDAEMSIFHVR